MRRRAALFTLSGILLLALNCTRDVERIVVVTPTAPAQTATPAPTYMREEVITLVRQHRLPAATPGSGWQTVNDLEAGSCGFLESDDEPILFPSYKAQYMGNGRWEVTTDCVDPSGRKVHVGFGTWHFLEDGNEVIFIFPTPAGE